MIISQDLSYKVSHSPGTSPGSLKRLNNVAGSCDETAVQRFGDAEVHTELVLAEDKSEYCE